MSAVQAAEACVGGYVLAGGKSSRMGSDKALVTLGGATLVERAVGKLREVCADVHILSSQPGLAQFGELVRDRHPECGPLGGVEAAMRHTRFAWVMVVAVDVPFLPVEVLRWWAGEVVSDAGTRVSVFSVGGRVQPAVLLARRELAGAVTGAIERGELRLYPALAGAAGVGGVRVMGIEDVAGGGDGGAAWFANVNTLEELEEARGRVKGERGAVHHREDAYGGPW